MKLKKILAAVLIIFVVSVNLLGQSKIQALGTLGSSCTTHADCSVPLSCMSWGMCDFGNNCTTDADCVAAHGSQWTCENAGTMGLACSYTGPRGSSTPPPTSTKTTTKTTKTLAPVDPDSPAAGLKFPDIFLGEGSQTTNLNGLKQSVAGSFKNLTIDQKEFGKVIFQSAINLNDSALIEKLKKLNEFLAFTKGSVDLNSEAIKELNVASEVTFKNLNLVENSYQILRNGNLAIGDEVTELKYDATSKTLIFKVKGFSKYQVNASFELTNKDEEVAKDEYTVNGILGDINSKVKVSLNGTQVNEVTPNIDGTFTSLLKLSPGKNEISFSTDSELVQEKQKIINVTYNEPVLKFVERNIGLIAELIIIVILLSVGIIYIIRKKRKANKDKKISAA